MAGECLWCNLGDAKIKSLVSGRCLECGGELSCEQGCYRAASYTDDTESNIALERGVCMICGGRVKCQKECW